MPSIIMESGKQNLQNVLEDDLGSELINAGRFCFSCEQIFANRQCLEEHVCSCASYICSCGTEFAEYKDMQEHSSTHEPGHQALDHETIRKRRIEKRIEEEQQLKRLQIGDVVWKTPKVNCVPPISLPVKPSLYKHNALSHMPQVPRLSTQISQVPLQCLSASQASIKPNAANSGTDIRNVFGNVSAPTVDLWTVYQPVVLVKTKHNPNKKNIYSCGKCGQCFMTRTSLVSHFSSHVTDKVSGCIGCGLLLSSKKVVPRFHVCNSPNVAAKFRLITARPHTYRKPNKAISEKIQNMSATVPRATSFLQMKSQSPVMAVQSSQTPRIMSTLQPKNEIIRTSSKGIYRPYVPPFLLSRSQNYHTSKPNVSILSKSLSTNPTTYNRSSQGLPVSPSGPLKTPTNSVLNNTIQTSSGRNGYMCRVCHLPFETSHMLQRHKCTKAQEFMAQHVRGGRNYNLKCVTPVTSSVSRQMNGERKLGTPTSRNGNKHQIMTVTLDKEDVDDDCYIVESGPDKSAEVIYQVTSSVPIKT